MSAFFRLWIQFSFRELRGHAWRTVAVLLGISLGAAVFTSVRLATNASVQSFANGIDAISGRADRTVTCPGGRLPEELVSVLLNSPDIIAASAFMSTYVRVEGGDEPLWLIGIDPILDRPLHTWKSGRSDSQEALSLWNGLIGSPFTMIAAKRFLKERGTGEGKPVRLQGASGVSLFQRIGRTCRRGARHTGGG